MILLIGLAVEYWYLSLGLVAIGAALVLVQASQQKQKARHRPGPRDPWLNEVAVALAGLGLTETARNTGAQLGGVQLEGDIAVEAGRLTVFVNLLRDDECARQAELGLRANPKIRGAASRGLSALKTVGPVVYVANGRGDVVDEFSLDEVVQTVSAIPVPPPLNLVHAVRGQPLMASRAQPSPSSFAHLSEANPDALEQLRKLGELQAAGVLTDDEFDAKKAELLRRV